ncbi:MAG: YncE family protein [Blastocatellales bacterium]
MKRRLFLITHCLALVIIAAISGNQNTSSAREPQGQQDPQLTREDEDARGVPGLGRRKGKMVIANRASGTISVIDAASDRVVGTYALPADTKTPEPMYVVYSRGRVFVGDRANNRVAVFNPRTFVVEGTVPAGAGIWHMWADPFDRQLWVNNDIDKTCTVIDPLTLQVLATVPTPADLASAGGKPHDVILDPVAGEFAYVSLIGVTGPADFVVKYSTQTFQEVGRVAVGKDPHLTATRRNNLLYVPCQNSNVVAVLDRGTLAPVTSILIPGAHGAGMAYDGETFYTTNLPGGGNDGLWTIDTNSNAVIGSPLDTPFPGPHNIALSPDRGIFFPNDRGGRKLYLTHSGATASKVTVYKLKGDLPVYHKEITVGFNPFGLAYVP